MTRYSKTKLRTGQTPAEVPQKKVPHRSVGSAISAEEEQFLLGDFDAPPAKKKPDHGK